MATGHQKGVGLHVALIEPTSLLGRDVRAVLEEKSFPIAKLHLLHAGVQKEGRLTRDDDEALYVAPLTVDSLELCQIAFLCGGSERTASFLSSRTDSCLVIDLSGLRTGGPFVVPSDDPAVVLPSGNLYLTPDSISYVVADIVKRLEALERVEGVTVAVDRPVSELGREALDELFAQSIALAAFRPVPKDVLKTQAAFNLFHPPDSEAFEARVVEDFNRLMKRSLPVAVLSARAGVFHGNHMRIEIRFAADAPSRDELRRVLFEGPEYADVDSEDLSGPVESAGRDETLVLRVGSKDRSAFIAVASDPLRQPGALLALRIAEQAVRERSLLPEA